VDIIEFKEVCRTSKIKKIRKHSIAVVVVMFFLRGSKLFFNNIISDFKFYINIFNPKNLMNTFYQYDPIKNTNKTLLINNMEDYTSFAYSELYFADGAKDHTIQLFENDLNTNQTKQLTTEFSNIDFIQIDKEQNILFMRVLLKDEYKNFHIATYNLQSNKVEIWANEDKDRSILDFNYNPNNNKLIVVSYSEKDDTKKLEEANNNNTKLQPPKYNLDIYIIQKEKKEHIDTVEKFIYGVLLFLITDLIFQQSGAFI